MIPYSIGSAIKRILPLVVVCLTLAASTAKADPVLQAATAGVTDQRVVTAVNDAVDFWNTRIVGYSSEVPNALRRQLSGLRVEAQVITIDGVGGTLASAGPSETLRLDTRGGNGFPPGFPGGSTGSGVRPWEIATAGGINFDIEDVATQTDEELFKVALHEIGHIIGIGTLWEANELTQFFFGEPTDADGNPVDQYVGKWALEQYREEFNPLASFVDIEEHGGGGTAGGHWDGLVLDADGNFVGFDNSFFYDQELQRQEVFTGFEIGWEQFVSETSWGAFADLGYKVTGINDHLIDIVFPGGGGRFPSKWGTGGGPVFRGINGVPEPSSMFLLIGLGAVGLGSRRRR